MDNIVNMVYLFIKTVHVLSAMALVGPLVLAPNWLSLSRHEDGKKALQHFHKIVGVAGWIVFLTGFSMLGLLNWTLLNTWWVQISMTMFVLIQLFDHFWADRRENDIETNPARSTVTLKIWLYTKIALYGVITILMVTKV